MASLRSDIGQLSSLFALEAAGRHGSFTRAAQELGVTQAAVSKQIVALEERIGQRLFLRKARHVELTAAGQELFTTTTFALGAIARSMRDLQEAGERPLTIALSIPLSQFWLMPRLQEFTFAHPEIPIRIIAQDAPEKVANADFNITFNRPGEVMGSDWTRLFGAEIRAMASGKFLSQHPLHSAAEVIGAPLIHYDAPDRSWLTWRDWALQAGLNPSGLRPALSVSRYEDALIAAQRGQGAMLVWCINGRPLIAGGELVALPGPKLAAPGAFYLRQGPAQPGMAEVLAWLETLAGRDAGAQDTAAS